ncbi:hypothetical protein Musp01_29260 [Muricauda sp. NBRC 101325]|nr:hypothetical protein Musp01_29260 [Muricauda sp. NBRC 101325]
MLASCTSENYNASDFVAGESFTDSNLRVVLVDTLTINTSTMKFDSIISSEANRILVGKYTDPVFGAVQSSSYFGMLPNEYTIDDEAVYDSIALILVPDNYYYNDTLQTNNIHVKRLTSALTTGEDDYFYNTTKAQYEDQDLGVINYAPRPWTADTLEIKLSDDLGKEFFTNFQEKLITTSDQFKDYFKGVALLPGEDDNGSVIGFSKSTTTCVIRVYYSIEEELERVDDYLEIALDQTSSPIPFFNQIKAENPSENLQNLVNQELNLSSSESDDLSFIQSGVGIATRIQFPYLKSMYDLNGQGTILDATLKIRPALNSYDDNLILRDTLAVFIVDQNNDLTSQLLIQDSAPVYGILNRDNEEFNDIYYEFSIGGYLDELLTTELETDDALILLPDSYISTVDRFILNGMDNSEYSALLELTYAIYDDEDE